MKQLMIAILFCAGALAFAAGCGAGGGNADGNNDGDGNGTPSDGDGDDDGHGHEGEENHLGDATIGAFTVHVTQIGDFEHDGDNIFELTVTGGDVKAIRGWVGDEAGEGTAVNTAIKGDDDWDLHVEGAEVAEGSKLWIEVEPVEGDKVTGSFDYVSHEED